LSISSTIPQDFSFPYSLRPESLFFNSLLPSYSTPKHFAAVTSVTNLKGNDFSLLPLLFGAEGLEINSRTFILMMCQDLSCQGCHLKYPCLTDHAEGGKVEAWGVMVWTKALRRMSPCLIKPYL
jgi:hypothetical protein